MNAYPTPTRRQFVKLFAFGVASTVLSGRGLHEMIIGEAQAADSANGLLTLKLSTFTALQSANSSIRLALNSFNPTAGFAAPTIRFSSTGAQETSFTHSLPSAPTLVV